VIAASAPRGGRIVLASADGRFLKAVPLADGCGVAPAMGSGAVLPTGGATIHAIPGARATASEPLALDNHLTGCEDETVPLSSRSLRSGCPG